MFSTTRRLAYASLALLGIACSSAIDVRTIAAPDMGATGLHTFRMLSGPARRDGRPTTGADDPMISNSIANRAIREQIVKTFVSRGYVVDERNPDFVVAFYATAREKLDVSAWDYDYPFNPAFGRYGRPEPAVTVFTEGSVIIDAVKAGTRQLLWRGEATAPLSDEPTENIQQLMKAADAIVAKFPEPRPSLVAVRP